MLKTGPDDNAMIGYASPPQDLPPQGPVRISDLCDADKSKIAKLIQQVVTLEQEKQQLSTQTKTKTDSYVDRLERLKKQNEVVIHETANLRSKFNQALVLLRTYQEKIVNLQAYAYSNESEATNSGFLGAAPDASDLAFSSTASDITPSSIMQSGAADPSEKDLLSSFEQLKHEHKQKVVAPETTEELNKLRAQLEQQHAHHIQEVQGEMAKQHAVERQVQLRAHQKKSDGALEKAIQALRREHQQEQTHSQERWRDELARNQMVQSDALESRLHQTVGSAVAKAREQER